MIDYKIAPRDSSGGRSDLFWNVLVIICCGAGGRGWWCGSFVAEKKEETIYYVGCGCVLLCGWL